MSGIAQKNVDTPVWKGGVLGFHPASCEMSSILKSCVRYPMLDIERWMFQLHVPYSHIPRFALYDIVAEAAKFADDALGA